MKSILFIFFNGGGLTYNQWSKHPYLPSVETNLIERIRKIGDVLLYNPPFYPASDGILQDFKLKHLNLIDHSNMVINQTASYNHYFIISHSRGWIFANHFISLFRDKIIGYINFDGGEPMDVLERRLGGWDNDNDILDKFNDIDDTKLSELIISANSADKKNIKRISRLVKYYCYKQEYELELKKLEYTTPTIIFNNIYNSDDINIKMHDYVDTTLVEKFAYNSQYKHNALVQSKWYVGRDHFVYFGIEDEIMDTINNIICTMHLDKKEIYVIRHGQTNWNKLGLRQGSKNDDELNNEGKLQAKLTGQYLRKKRTESGKFDLIICSTLKRAKETATLIAHEIEYTQPIIYMDELKELDLGLIAIGKREHEMRNDKFYDEYWKIHDTKHKLDKLKQKEMIFDNLLIYEEKYKIEPPQQIIKRLEHVRNFIIQNKYKKIIIVSHSGVIEWMNRSWLNVYDYLSGIKNCSISYYTMEGCTLKLLANASNSHLEPEK